MITIVNHSLLTPIERELIEKIMDFQFTPNICFKNWENQMTVEISKAAKVRNDRIPVSRKDIEDALKAAEKKFTAAEGQYKRTWSEISRLMERNNEPGVQEQLEKLHKQRNLAEAEMARAHNAIDRYKGMLSEGVDSFYPQRKILGEFLPGPSPMVVLYLGSFSYAESSRHVELIPTFIHEMFHAVNYFNSSGPDRVREVEEPMVEFAAGVFLAKMSKTDNSFKECFEHHRINVLDKSNHIGEVVCYGFGAYLMDHVSELSTHNEEEWIETYSQKAWGVNPTDSIPGKIVSSLYPSYPKDESRVLQLFEILLFGKRSKRKTVKDTQVEPDWSKWGITSTPSDTYELFPFFSSRKLIPAIEDIILILKHKGFESALSIDEDFDMEDVVYVTYSGSFLFYCSLKPSSPDPDFFVVRESMCVNGTTVYPLFPLRESYGHRPQMAIGRIIHILSMVFGEVFTLVNDFNGYTLYGNKPNSEVSSILCSKRSAGLRYDIIVKSTSEVIGRHKSMRQVPLLIVKHFCDNNKGIEYSSLNRIFNGIKCHHVPRYPGMIIPKIMVDKYAVDLAGKGHNPDDTRVHKEPIELASGDVVYVTDQWACPDNFSDFKALADSLGYEIIGY